MRSALMLVAVKALVLLFGGLALVSSCGPQTDLSGTYFGSMLVTGPCSNGASLYDTSSVAVVVDDLGSSVVAEFVGLCDPFEVTLTDRLARLDKHQCPTFQRQGAAWVYAIESGRLTFLRDRALDVDVTATLVKTAFDGPPITCALRWQNALVLQE